MLYEHQRTGASWLAERTRGLLTDVPGLGKTYSLLEAAALAADAPPVVICPAIVRTHWRRVADAMDMTVHVFSYDEVVRRGALPYKPNCLLLDEIHYLKNPSAQRTKLILGKTGIARKVPIVYGASGTLVSKHPAELWPVLASLFPDVAAAHGLHTYRDFLDRFCLVYQQHIGHGRVVERIRPELQHAAEFQEILSAISLRRTLDDVGLDVPPLDWQTLEIDLVTKPDEEGVDPDMPANPNTARYRREVGEGKAVPAARLIAEVLDETDEKVVVFAYHRSVLDCLRAALGEYGVAYVDGDVTGTARDSAIDRFQERPGTRVFLGQNIACQTGITLTAARRVYLVEPEFTRDVNYQLGKRVARIGQTAERCVVHMLCVADSLDYSITRRNQQELQMAEAAGMVAA